MHVFEWCVHCHRNEKSFRGVAVALGLYSLLLVAAAFVMKFVH